MHTADAVQADAHLDPGRFPRERFRSRGAGMTPGERLGECVGAMGSAVDVDCQRLERDELAFRRIDRRRIDSKVNGFNHLSAATFD